METRCLSGTAALLQIVFFRSFLSFISKFLFQPLIVPLQKLRKVLRVSFKSFSISDVALGHCSSQLSKQILHCRLDILSSWVVLTTPPSDFVSEDDDAEVLEIVLASSQSDRVRVLLQRLLGRGYQAMCFAFLGVKLRVDPRQCPRVMDVGWNHINYNK